MSADISRRGFLQQACGASAMAACLGALSADLAALPTTELHALDHALDVGASDRRAQGASAARERTYPVPAADGVSVDRSVALMLVRLQGRVFALGQTCPHQNAAVRWLERDRRFQCTKHDSKYQPDGVYMSGQSTRHLDRFAIRMGPAGLIVNLDQVFKADADPAGWAAAVVTVSPSEEERAAR